MSVDGASQSLEPYIQRGTPAFRRTNLALFSAGFSTFALMYCVQPLMPLFSREFHVDAATSSLSLSLTTGLLAIAMLVAGSLSEAWGRKPVMVASLTMSAALTVVSAVMPGWRSFLFIRALQGLAFSGLPAVAMAYLSEEMHIGSVGLAMGLYISGSALGGMSGRLIAGALTDLVGWRFAIAVIGVLGLVAAFIFWRSLPPSARFQPRPLALRQLLASFAGHLRDPGLRSLFLEGFLLMGTFVTMYNYIGYRLSAPPYDLSQAAVGSIFVVYLVGIFSSSWVGDLAGRRGHAKTFWAPIVLMLLGLAVTLSSPLAAIIVGIAILTFGFFGAHSVASTWVGLRARHSKAQASSLYLFFYYVGSSAVGSSGGLFWSASGWPGVAAFTGALLVLALFISLRLITIKIRD